MKTYQKKSNTPQFHIPGGGPHRMSDTQLPPMSSLRAMMESSEPNQRGRKIDLQTAMRAKMENAFGADLSHIRLYESQAVADAGASALAQGSDIAFAPGQSDFSSMQGQALLGHELSHVVTQARGEAHGSGMLENPSLESRADQEGRMAAHGERIYPDTATPSVIPLTGNAPIQACPKRSNHETEKYDEKYTIGDDTSFLFNYLKKIQNDPMLADPRFQDPMLKKYQDLRYNPRVIGNQQIPGISKKPVPPGTTGISNILGLQGILRILGVPQFTSIQPQGDQGTMNTLAITPGNGPWISVQQNPEKPELQDVHLTLNPGSTDFVPPFCSHLPGAASFAGASLPAVQLEYTQHAQIRMFERNITGKDVEMATKDRNPIFKNGKKYCKCEIEKNDNIGVITNSNGVILAVFRLENGNSVPEEELGKKYEEKETETSDKNASDQNNYPLELGNLYPSSIVIHQMLRDNITRLDVQKVLSKGPKTKYGKALYYYEAEIQKNDIIQVVLGQGQHSGKYDTVVTAYRLGSQEDVGGRSYKPQPKSTGDSDGSSSSSSSSAAAASGPAAAASGPAAAASSSPLSSSHSSKPPLLPTPKLPSYSSSSLAASSGSPSPPSGPLPSDSSSSSASSGPLLSDNRTFTFKGKTFCYSQIPLFHPKSSSSPSSGPAAASSGSPSPPSGPLPSDSSSSLPRSEKEDKK